MPPPGQTGVSAADFLKTGVDEGEMSEQSIGDILNDEPAPEPAVEAPQEAETPTEAIEEPTETVERPRGPDGKFISKETGVETPVVEAAEPVPPTEQPNQLPPHEYAALKDERRKRQELEQRLQMMEQQFRQPAPQPQPQPVDFWDDPQSFMDSRLNQLGEQLLQQWDQKQQVNRINASEEAAKAKYADYPDAYQAFEQAVQINPRLAYELAQAPDPGEFAYSRGKTALEIQRVGSVDALRAQIRAEVEAEARAQFQPAQRLVLPSTTAADGSMGTRSGPEWAGPKPLGDILS